MLGYWRVYLSHHRSGEVGPRGEQLEKATQHSGSELSKDTRSGNSGALGTCQLPGLGKWPRFSGPQFLNCQLRLITEPTWKSCEDKRVQKSRG